jgi:hypothetical protein
VPPRTLNPLVDRDLEAVCLKCLEKDPGNRYGSASELADDLDRWARGEPTRARPPSTWQAVQYWLRRNFRAALWVLAVGLALGVLLGCAVYTRILQDPLADAADSSYGRLPATARPWLAALPRPEGAARTALNLSTLLAITTAGLVIVLLARPNSPGADLYHGLAVGLVAAYVSLLCSGAWAFAGVRVKNTLLGVENRLAIEQDLLKRPHDPVEDRLFIQGFGELRREVYPPDWQEHRYPDLKGLAREDQRKILYDKMVCDAMISVQDGLLWAMPIYLTVLILVPALEALAAGSLWRRHRRMWPVLLGYVERVIPLAITLNFAVGTILAAVALRVNVIGDWLGTFQRAFWPMELGLAVLVVAQVAAWRGWRRWVRLLLHACWIGLLAWAKSRLP